jgi:hypothetical protein
MGRDCLHQSEEVAHKPQSSLSLLLPLSAKRLYSSAFSRSGFSTSDAGYL